MFSKRRRFELASLCMGTLFLASCFTPVDSKSSGDEPTRILEANAKLSLEKNLNGKGFQGSYRINDFIGVHQSQGRATVFYLASGREPSFGASSFSNLLSAVDCWFLNSGRWYCQEDVPGDSLGGMSYVFFFIE